MPGCDGARFGKALLIALGLMVIPAAASSQQWSLTFDNDVIGLRGMGHPPDYDYTSGLRLERRSGAVHFAFGQEIYTPRRDSVAPVPGERPYAAWAYGEVGLARSAGGSRVASETAVSIGLVGPAALGEEVQNGIHALTGSKPQRGWEHQLRIAPAVQVRSAHAIRLPLRADTSLALTPLVRAEAGNIRVSAGAGVALSVGGIEGVDRPGAGFGAALETLVSWKPWDALLDRLPAPDLEPLDREPVLAEFRAAASYGFSRWAIQYSFILRSREYHAQLEAPRYGSLRLAWWPGR